MLAGPDVERVDVERVEVDVDGRLCALQVEGMWKKNGGGGAEGTREPSIALLSLPELAGGAVAWWGVVRGEVLLRAKSCKLGMCSFSPVKRRLSHWSK